MKPLEKARFITNNGTRVYYWVKPIDRGTGEWWVLYPASSCNSSSLEPLEKGLNEQGISTVLIEPRGTGISDTKVPGEDPGITLGYYSRESMATDLEMVIDSVGLHKPVLFGHSRGFHVIVEYASRTGNARELWGAHTSHNFKESSLLPLFQLYRLSRYAIFAGKRFKDLEHMVLGTRRKPYLDQSRFVRRSDAAYWLGFVDQEAKMLRASVSASNAVLNSDISRQLETLDIPVFIIQGYLDFFIMKRRVRINQYARNFCGQAMVWAGHTCPITHPDRTMAAINRLREAYYKGARILSQASLKGTAQGQSS